jgi:hypothetical protein
MRFLLKKEKPGQKLLRFAQAVGDFTLPFPAVKSATASKRKGICHVFVFLCNNYNIFSKKSQQFCGWY